MIFKRISSKDGTGTLSYVLADGDTRNGIIIDPNIEDLKNIIELVEESGLTLKYVVDTHTHADHISAAGELKALYGTRLIMHTNTKNKWKVVDEGDNFGIGDIIRSNAALEVDRFAEDEDELSLDSLHMKFLFTPGHTDNHISVLTENMLFTGDLLLIGQAGRSDLPGGNAEDQYDSLFNKIVKLPSGTKIYPGHDYEDNEYSLLADEMNNNPFLQQRTKEEYIEFVRDFFPPVSEAALNGKVTLQCGTKRITAEKDEAFRNIDADELYKLMSGEKDLYLLDVREPFELMAFGAIPGVKNIPAGRVLSNIDILPRDKKIIVICQSGNRSYEIAHYLSGRGFNKVYNLLGGTSSWLYGKNRNKIKYNKVI